MAKQKSLKCWLSVIGLGLGACAGEIKKSELPLELSGNSLRTTTCFSPAEQCDQQLIAFIRGAKKSVDVAVFSLTHPQIVHEILVAARRVPTRIIVDRRQSKEKHSLVSTLIKARANVRYGYQRGIMHHKFVVVDGARLETGSFNFTDGATFKNQENQVYLDDESIVKRFRTQFEKMWEEARAD